MQQSFKNEGTVAFPWVNTQILAESLRNGELCLTTAISQLNAVMRESLKVIEEIAKEKVDTNIELKGKACKMEKLIDDLTEKCQSMQQALLYKEEKYDEKCREVERYKVICELSSKAVINDDHYYTKNSGNNNLSDFLDQEYEDSTQDERVEPLINKTMTPISQKSVKTHTKLNQNQVHMSNYISAMGSDVAPSNRSVRSDLGENNRQINIAAHYLGGPCKRKKNQNEIAGVHNENSINNRLSIIGGINVKGPKIGSGPVPTNKLYRTNEVPGEDKRVKIALVGQSNEVMSSSKNAVYRMKQKFTEKDLHRQVAGGCWTQMSSRRKKEWPF